MDVIEIESSDEEIMVPENVKGKTIDLTTELEEAGGNGWDVIEIK